MTSDHFQIELLVAELLTYARYVNLLSLKRFVTYEHFFFFKGGAQRSQGTLWNLVAKLKAMLAKCI